MLAVSFSPDVTNDDTGLGVDTDPEYSDTALPAADGTTAAAAGAAPTVATTTTKEAVAGVTKKRRIKHNHAAQDARKDQHCRLLAKHDGAPGPGTGSSSRRPSDT